MGGELMPHIDDLLIIKEHRPGYKQHWTYLDNGKPVMAVARYDAGTEKTYRQFHLQNDEWVEGMPPSPYPLFGLHTSNQSSPFNALFVTEGEKCASVLHQLRWPAISPALGAQNPCSSDWNPCRYYNRFIILRDNDKSGISFVQKISAEIRRVQPNSELLVVNLTPDTKGGDLVDWLQNTILRGQGWDGFEELPKEALERIKISLSNEIKGSMIRCEDCPHVSFKPIQALFEGEPTPFKVELTPVQPFPLDIFPTQISEYIALTSSQYSQVPDYAATVLIALTGGLIGRSIHLRMRPIDTWVETANCWCILVGQPSAKKSPISRRIFSLLKPLEKKADEDFAEESRSFKARKKAAEKNSEDFEESPPIRRRYLTDDVTTPKLRELMAGNPRGIILRNDELKGQIERLDKQGNEGDRSFMMSCWSGLEDYTEDRMCRDSLLNIPLALTWIGCIPPSPLQRYLCEAMGRSNGADGFMQRFQFVCYPDQNIPYRLPDLPVPVDLEKGVQRIVEQIDDDATCSSRILAFSKDAQGHFDEWLFKHENDSRLGGHPLYWESHLGKQAKVVAVLVIVIHRLAEASSGKQDNQVSLETLMAALRGQSYFLSHARRCYDSIAGGTVNDAEIILSLVRQKRISNRFKAQDIYHQGLGGLSDSGRVRAALELLRDYGWVVSEKIGGGTGRHSEFWTVHPSVISNR